MRCLLTAIALITATIFAMGASGAGPPATRQPKEGVVSSAGEPMLIMVFIRASAPGAVQQLRAMHLDIIRVRPDPERPADKNSLAGGVIVEAVAPKNILPKLKAMGFDVSEVPPKYN